MQCHNSKKVCGLDQGAIPRVSAQSQALKRVWGHSRALGYLRGVLGQSRTLGHLRGVLGQSREISRRSSVNSVRARRSPNLRGGIAGAGSTLNQAASPRSRNKLSTNARELDRIKINLSGLDDLRALDSHKDLSQLKSLNNQEPPHNHRYLNNQEQPQYRKDSINQEPVYSLKDSNNHGPVFNLRDLTSQEQINFKILHKSPKDLKDRPQHKGSHHNSRIVQTCKGSKRGSRTTWTNLSTTNWIWQAVQIRQQICNKTNSDRLQFPNSRPDQAVSSRWGSTVAAAQFWFSADTPLCANVVLDWYATSSTF